MLKNAEPVIVTVPCFSGAPWQTEPLVPLSHRPVVSMRLPESKDNIETYADFAGQQVEGISKYVQVGDSFGAVVALAFASHDQQLQQLWCYPVGLHQIRLPIHY